jgi:hypothetical protein
MGKGELRHNSIPNSLRSDLGILLRGFNIVLSKGLLIPKLSHHP